MTEKTSNIINRLMNDPDHYRAMSEQENQAWGNILSDEERNRAILADQAAARELNLNRRQIHIAQTLRKHGLAPGSGLSLACGNGRAERQLMQQGICSQFHGVDIAEGALDTARHEARQANLDIRYEQADLNAVELPEAAFDLVVTQNCLHHVLKLEHLAQQIRRSLKPCGVLWISDFIGETQFQYGDLRLAIVNKLLATLPEACLKDSVNQREVRQLVRREPGTLVSPFEAIRSGDIMPVFLEYFDILEKSESDSILKFVCPVGTRGAFNASDKNRALFETLMQLDDLLIATHVLTPVTGTYLLKAKPY